MIHAFLIDTASGQTEQRVSAPSEAFLDVSPYGAGKAFALFDPTLGDIEDFETELAGGTVNIVPRTIDPAQQLAIAQIALGERVRQLRDSAEWGGCMTPYGPIDTDPDSQRKIGGGSTAALAMGTAFAKEWRMADNTLVTLDAAKMIEIGLIVVSHVDACQTRKNALDAEIGAAETLADLEAINVTAGWPA